MSHLADKPTGRKRRAARVLAYGCLLLAIQPWVAAVPAWSAAPPATELPTGGNVTSGSANINSSGATLNVNQSTQQATINWNTFNVGSQATVNFNQPNASSQTLNRVLDSNASQIYGHINANGQVFLVNPNGIVFGAGSQVNAAGLVASTLNITDQDFQNGNYQFQGNGSSGTVTNQGTLNATQGGYVALIGSKVVNQGQINTPGGKAILAAGTKVTVPLTTSGLITMDVDAGDLDADVTNDTGGTINASGGQVVMQAEAGPNNSALITNNGTINAKNVQATSQTGTVYTNAGSNINAHNINVSANSVIGAGNMTSHGGSINVNAGYVSLAGSLIADSTHGTGGNITIGGTTAVLLSGTSLISASGISGGNIAVTSAQGFLLASGVIHAKGSAGVGGTIKLSGVASTTLLGATVDASGTLGGGTVHIGGDWHGQGSLPVSLTTTIDTASTILANATDSGNGGEVVLWSANATSFYGNIAAMGGPNGGNGGQVELSSAGQLNQTISPGNGVNVAALAAGGANGTVTVDPSNVVIGDAMQSFDIFEALLTGSGAGVNTGMPTLSTGNAFGSSVALSDTYALIGADGVSSSRGDAYLYNLVTGSWTDLATTSGQPITGLASSSLFGVSAALNGSYALIGAQGVASSRGDAYLYNLTTGTWTDLATSSGQPVTALAASSLFGDSVALNSTYALIGADAANSHGDAYLYNLSSGAWTDLATTSGQPITGLVSTAAFGVGVALNSAYALIGADGVTTNRGTAYLYNLSTGTWTNLAATSGQPITGLGSNAYFGESVALNNSYALIAEPTSSSVSNAFLYNLSTGAWTNLGTTAGEVLSVLASATSTNVHVALNDFYALIGEKNASDAYLYNLSSGAWTNLGATSGVPLQSSGAAFGSSVALNDTYALIGAPGQLSGTGDAYLYNITTPGWTDLAPEGQPITALSSTAKFGSSVALTDSYALIGASGVSSQGDAYLYNLTNGAWTDLATTGGQPVTALSTGSNFGASVALSSAYALIGAYGVASSQGDAYLYNLSTGAWTDLATTASQPITALASSSNFGFSVALNSTYALIGAYGAASGEGDAYLYKIATGAWTNLATTTNEPIAALGTSAQFGYSVALNTTQALIGSPGASSTGDAFLYTLAGGSSAWTDLATTTNQPVTTVGSGAKFGDAVALSSTEALIGADGVSSSRGNAFLYLLSGGASAWTNLAATSGNPITALSGAEYGYSVALNSNYVLVGAPDAGTGNRGDAYLYNISTGAWTDLAETTNQPVTGAAASSLFGTSVALNSTEGLIGATGASSSGQGDAYLYNISTGAWTDLSTVASHTLAAPGSGSAFGSSVALTDAYALIGASNADGSTGDAYLYNLTNGRWTDLATTTGQPITGLANDSLFGAAVALNSTYALIGATGDGSTGDAFLYNISNGYWTNLATSPGQPITTLSVGANFGFSVALNSTYALIGANLQSNKGDAFLYNLTNGSWTDLATTPSQPISGLANNSQFGSSVALNDNYALIGADGASSGRGDAFLYLLSNGTWTDLTSTAGQPITALGANAAFGSSMALTNAYALIGADGVSSGRGDAYLYNFSTGAWTDLAATTGQPVSGLASSAAFGDSAALNSTYALIGADGVSSSRGDAYLYNISTGTWTDLASVASSPVSGLASSSSFGGSVALNTNYALIGASGAGSDGNAYLVYLPYETVTTVTPETIAAGLASGNYTVVADNSLTINNLQLATVNTGNSLTLESGGSLAVDANVVLGGRTATLLANAPNTALGSPSNRLAGAAGFTVASGDSIDDGSGSLTLQIGTDTASGRSGGFATAGDFALNGAVSAGTLLINGSESNINVGAALTGTGTGAALTLNGLTESGSGALNTPNGYWQIYNSNSASLGTITLSGLAAHSDRYGCTLSGGCTTGAVLPTSDAIVYAFAPTLTLTDGSTVTKVYDDTTTSSTAGITVSGAVNGDSVSLASAVYSGANVGTGLAITYTLNQAYGYQFTGTPTTGNITQAPLTVTANSQTKQYGNTFTFAGTEYTTTGTLYGTDAVTSATITSAGAAATANVAGSPYAINISGATGSGLSNYNITYVNSNMTVTQAPLTVTANSQTKQYGTNFTFAGTEFTTTGTLYNGNTITGATITSAGAAGTAQVAGSPYAISISSATGTGVSNYAITYVGSNFAVTPAPLTVTANSQTKQYGTTFTFAGTEFTTTGTLYNGDAVTSATIASSGSAATANVAGSPYAISISGATGSGLSNYTITYVGNNMTVTPAPLTVTASSQTKTYGTNFTFAGTEFTTGTLYNGDTVTSATITSAGAAGTAQVAGSPYAISISGAAGNGLSNYTITYVGNTFTVNPAPLTVTANSQSKVYGGAFTFAGTEFTTTGTLYNGDTATGATITSAGAAATAQVVGSPYAINISGATGSGLSNYTITYVGNNFAVTPAPLTVTANSQTKTYGTNFTFAGTEFTTGTLYNGDTVTSATITSAGAAGTAQVAGSPYAISISGAAGNGLSNYTITYVGNTFTVNPAPLTVTANSQSKVYGGAFTFAGTEFTTTGTLYNGDAVTGATITSSGAAGTAQVAGSPYAISISSATGTGVSNYAITYVGNTFTVNPAPITVTANSQTKTYGTNFTFAGTEFTTTGTLYNGDAVTSATITSAGAAGTANVAGSPYAINISGAAGSGLSNYTITYVGNNMTVNPAPLTVTASDQSKVYGSNFTFAGTEFTTTGTLYNGDTVTGATLASTGAAGTANVAGSPYAISASNATGSGVSNYDITYVNGNMTVTPAPLTVAANSQSKVYGSNLTFAGTEFTTTGTLYNGDTVTGATIASAGAAGTATVTGGPYAISISSATGSGVSNYAITYVGNNLTVTPAPLTVVITANGKVYDGTTAATLTSMNLSGAIYNGDGSNLTVTDTAVGFDSKDTNATGVIASGLSLNGTAASNYALTSTTASTAATITPAPLTISGVTGTNKVDDGTVADNLNVSNAVLSGILGSDSVGVASGSGVFADNIPAMGKSVTATGFVLDGAEGLDYQVMPLPTGLFATISPKPTSNNATSSITSSTPDDAASAANDNNAAGSGNGTTGNATAVASNANNAANDPNWINQNISFNDVTALQAPEPGSVPVPPPVSKVAAAQNYDSIPGSSNPSIFYNNSQIQSGVDLLGQLTLKDPDVIKILNVTTENKQPLPDGMRFYPITGVLYVAQSMSNMTLNLSVLNRLTGVVDLPVDLVELQSSASADSP